MSISEWAAIVVAIDAYGQQMYEHGRARPDDTVGSRAALITAIEAAIEQARCEGANGIGLTKPVDPREPDPTRTGFWALHNCGKCRDGKQQCVADDPNQCYYPRARND